MKNYTKWIITLFFVFSTSFIWADSEMPPYTHETKSENGDFFFKMIPAKNYNINDGEGICYRVTENDKNEIFWKSSGWYSYIVFLSNNGKYLIRMGNWPRGHELSDEHLAVAFYEEDKLLRSYSTKDLVKDSSSIEISISHYSWTLDHPKFYSNKKEFQLITKDKIIYIFDITNGEIISRKKLK